MTAQPPAATLRRAMLVARAPFRPRGGQARCAVDAARHGGEGGCDRAAVRVDVPFATVVAPAGYGKTTLLHGGPRPIRVRSRGSRSTARDDDAVVFLRYVAAAIHRVEPLPPEVFDALSGPGGRPGRTASRGSGARWRRSSARWCWCSTTCTPSPIRPVSTCSRSCSSTCRTARRSRSRAGRSRRCRSPAGGRTAWCTRSASRTSGWTSRRPGCCWRPPASSWTRASSPS